MVKEVEISVLNQLILNLEKRIEKLKKAYETKDSGEFNQVKKQILEIQREIFEVIK